jgi:hypothetical protein
MQGESSGTLWADRASSAGNSLAKIGKSITDKKIGKNVNIIGPSDP